jgi:hypothetical protein
MTEEKQMLRLFQGGWTVDCRGIFGIGAGSAVPAITEPQREFERATTCGKDAQNFKLPHSILYLARAEVPPPANRGRPEHCGRRWVLLWRTRNRAVEEIASELLDNACDRSRNQTLQTSEKVRSRTWHSFRNRT